MSKLRKVQKTMEMKKKKGQERHVHLGQEGVKTDHFSEIPQERWEAKIESDKQKVQSSVTLRW